ncbi:cupin domain-containing protein [Kitasatospora sp. NBC_00240]|uniref:cupin domain-containing protein n=1 Tax=Kitasatospora sp. NBC_00240 TaxID=2903567 RepID=UPI002255BACB|nr:cupin domain-containing protein [Kitasatospora sp. NBC_00240]MCX5213701.1 cupin domain-containing protein [Kitasatospora sp. NBC_00240]
MPFVPADAATVHEIHGARFTSYASTASGSTELCAWRLDVPAGSVGVPHTVGREEILLLLSGSLLITLDDEERKVLPGDTAIVPAGTVLKVDNPDDRPARAWVTTSTGLTATLPDGSVFTPPWAS